MARSIMTNVDRRMLEEMEGKIHSEYRVITHLLLTEDYTALKEVFASIRSFAKEKWTGYVNPKVWTKEEHDISTKTI